jgi:Glycosyl hydrolase catalytic core
VALALVVAAASQPVACGSSARRFLLGVNAGYWGPKESRDLRRIATVVRLTNPPRLARWERAGLRVIADFSGPYTRAGVSGLDHAAYVARVASFVRQNPHVLAIEVLNEPGGPWFWGSEAESAENRESYAQLLIEVHDALVRDFGARRPLELASWDGGHDSSNAWGEAWSQNATALADVDAVTNHPYGGTGPRAQAIQGDRAEVEADEAVSHKPIWITEVGFPTGHNLGDSLLYSEAEQATAIGSFARWARQKEYIAGVTFYGYRDAHDGGGYGIETHHGHRKPAFGVLERLQRD